MGLEIRYAKRTAPRIRAPRTRATLRRRKLRLFKGEPHPTEAVLDLSSTGMKILARGSPLAKGDRLSVDFGHASLGAKKLELEGVVRWVRPEPGAGAGYSAGVEFVDVKEAARARLERLIAIELGSLVSIGPRHVGFAARGAAEADLAGTLFVYDRDRNEVGQIVDEKLYLHATRTREGEIERKQAGTLAPLLKWMFDEKEGKVDIDPPIDFEPGKT